jgi:type III restriction enzyme
MPSAIPHLIINSPYHEPSHYWSYDRETRTFSLKDGRRPAGYVRASEHSKSFDDPGVFIELPLVNQIRSRVNAWRAAGYPGVTGITKRLLEHWRDPEQREGRRLFFCQLEAIETLIWLLEASPAERQGLEIPSDGGPFARLCCKMATGSGKTIVMAMLIAWQVLNKVTYPQDKRFTKHVFVVAPGLTVKSRLQVLQPSGSGNYYDEFSLVPVGLLDKLRQGKVLIRNWHWLMPLDPDAGPKVMKKGPESDEGSRGACSGRWRRTQFLVINDEAHHAWQKLPKSDQRRAGRHRRATQWIGGLMHPQDARRADVFRPVSDAVRSHG